MALVHIWRGRARPGMGFGSQNQSAVETTPVEGQGDQDGARFWWCQGPGKNVDISEAGSIAEGTHLV